MLNLTLESFNGGGRGNNLRGITADRLLAISNQSLVVASEGTEFFLEQVEFVLNVDCRRRIVRRYGGALCFDLSTVQPNAEQYWVRPYPCKWQRF